MNTPYLSKFVLIFSILNLFNMGFQTFYKQTENVYFLLNVFDSFVCGIFINNWIVNFRNAKDKKAFLKWGWFDLLLSIPMPHSIWIQYHTVLRLIRSIRSLKYIYDYFSADEKTSKFVDCCFVGITFVLFSAIAVFNCEKHIDGANIKNLSDSLWWAMATVTTIGYGDRYPVSDIGRVIGGFVMIIGVGLYASFTGFIVSKFISDERVDELLKDNEEMKKTLKQILEKP